MKNHEISFGLAAKYAAISENYISETLGMKKEFSAAVEFCANRDMTSPGSSKHLSDPHNLLKIKLNAVNMVVEKLPAGKKKHISYYINSIAGDNLLNPVTCNFGEIASHAAKPSIAGTFRNIREAFSEDAYRLSSPGNYSYAKSIRREARLHRKSILGL